MNARTTAERKRAALEEGQAWSPTGFSPGLAAGQRHLSGTALDGGISASAASVGSAEPAGTSTTAASRGAGFDFGRLPTFPEPARPVAGQQEREEESWWDKGIDWVEGAVSSRAHGLAKEVAGMPVLGAEAEAAASMADTYTQFESGILKGAGTLVGGLVNMVEHPVQTAEGLEAMAEHVSPLPGMPNPLKLAHGLYNVATGEESLGHMAEHDLNPLQSARDDLAFFGKVGQGIIRPYHQEIAQGKYAEALGRGVFDVGSIVLTEGAGAEVEGAADVARGAEVTGELAEAGGVGGDVLRLGEGGGPGRTVLEPHPFEVVEDELLPVEPAPAELPIPEAPGEGMAPSGVDVAPEAPRRSDRLAHETESGEPVRSAMSREDELKKLIADQAADQASGDVGLVDVEPGAENVLDLPEHQEGVATASEIFESLPDIENPKNMASGVEGEPRTSGWAGDKMEATERARAEGVEAGHETEPHFRDPEGAEGQYESSHSERQRAAGTSDQHFGSSKPLCPACQRWFAARAGLEGRPQFVADPTGVHVFLPDGRHTIQPHPSGAVTIP